MLTMACPASMRRHAAKVLGGEYDIPGLEFPKPPVILDVGANVGAFALWALQRWPGCFVHCYEPHPITYRTLYRNMSDTGLSTCHKNAVVGEGFGFRPGPVDLWDGRNNCGEASLFKGEEQADTLHQVQAVSALSLPPADIIKVDTEGCEYGILRDYLTGRDDTAPRAVMYEWHRVKDRWLIAGMLAAGDYVCVRDEVRVRKMGAEPHAGLMLWRLP